MENTLTLLYSSVDPLFLPGVALVGGKEVYDAHEPYELEGIFSFSRRSISIEIRFEEEEWEVTTHLYRGIPDWKQLPPNSIGANGYIEVTDKQLIMYVGDYIPWESPWPNGLTAVYANVDATEAAENRIRTVTFYIQPFRKPRIQLFGWGY